MSYNGTTALQPEIAKILGVSVKSQASTARATKEAKQALGIVTETRALSKGDRVRVCEYLISKHNNQADENIPAIPRQEKTPADTVTQLLEVTLKNNVITGISVKNNPVKTTLHDSNLNSQVKNFDDVRIAFYVNRHDERKRQVVSLDGFFINALASIGVLKQDLPQWVQAKVDGWTAFDSQLPITRQVKYLIMREVVTGLGGGDGLFYSLNE